MTTEPNKLTVGINHERMPVLLSEPEHFCTWLNGSPEEAFALARPYSAERCGSCSRARIARTCYRRLSGQHP